MPLSELKRRGMAMRWLIKAARSSKGKPMADRLYKEIMDAYKLEVLDIYVIVSVVAKMCTQGSAMKRRLELHKTAEANRAYAHLRR